MRGRRREYMPLTYSSRYPVNAAPTHRDSPMYQSKLASVAVGLALLLSTVHPEVRADGVCTVRAATAAEKKSYADAYALFLRVAPKAPAGWASTDNPRTGATPVLCSDRGAAPLRMHS